MAGAVGKVKTSGSIRGVINAAQAPEKIAREQYQYYEDEFIPSERKFAGLIRKPEEIERIAQNTGISALSSTANADLGRDMGRFGLNLDPTQQAELKQMQSMGDAGAVAGAKTRTRGGLYDLNLQRQGEFAGLGRGLATTSTGAINTSAANKNATDSANKQMAAQHQSSMIQTGVTLGVGVVLF
jgi:hypothetical protein